MCHLWNLGVLQGGGSPPAGACCEVRPPRRSAGPLPGEPVLLLARSAGAPSMRGAPWPGASSRQAPSTSGVATNSRQLPAPLLGLTAPIEGALPSTGPQSSGHPGCVCRGARPSAAEPSGSVPTVRPQQPSGPRLASRAPQTRFPPAPAGPALASGSTCPEHYPACFFPVTSPRSPRLFYRLLVTLCLFKM